jgi:hypothetical protein
VSRTRAIVALRFKLLTRRMQGAGGALNLVGAALLSILGILFALGLAVGLGLLVFALVSSGEARKIRIGFLVVFYLAFVFGLIIPVLRGAMDQGFDASPFVVFPISRRRLYLISVAACFGGVDHMLYYPMLAAVAVTGVLLPGANAVLGLSLIGLSVVFLVLAGNALALFLVSVMRARRVREITGIAALVLIIGLSFSTLLLDNSDNPLKETMPHLTAALVVAKQVARVLPPSIAAEGMTALHEAGAGVRAASSVAWLLLWNLGVGLIGYLIFDRYHLAERGVKVAGREKRRGAFGAALGALCSMDRRPFSALAPEVRAVAAKDLHYLFRSVLGRFNLFMLPVFVFLIVFAVGRALEEPVLGIEPDRLVLFGLVFYTVLFSNNFVNNCFAWDGDGIKSYYLSPVMLRRVLLGKNLALWLYNVLLFALVLVSWSVVMGPPSPVLILSLMFLFVTALVIFTGVGNVLSVLFPIPRDMSSIRNQPSQAAVLLGILLFVAVGVVLGAALSVPMVLGWPAAQPAFLGAALIAGIGVYVVSLNQATELLETRRERIIEALKVVR